MKRLIAIQNIIYFKRLLEDELDPERRVIVEHLLCKEEDQIARAVPKLTSTNASVAWRSLSK